MKHANIALFVPHNGCPHQCSFCNQRSITGVQYQPTADDVISAVSIARESLKERTKKAEIAFFGGSFTAIDSSYMKQLLGAAYPFVKSGEFAGIRISTRPDCISRDILNTLSDYGVTSIELGAQSMLDNVLKANFRGHTVRDVCTSSHLIKEYGFSLGLQMMTGLYKSDEEKDILTAQKIAELMPDTVRIYPTLIMKNTYLEELYMQGEYKPTELEATVSLCAGLLKFFEEKGINVIRLGLHSSESMQRDLIAGAFHPSLRELCQSKLMLDDVLEAVKNNNINTKNLEITVNPKSVSKLCGQKRSNISKLNSLGYNVKILQSDAIAENTVNVKAAGL